MAARNILFESLNISNVVQKLDYEKLPVIERVRVRMCLYRLTIGPDPRHRSSFFTRYAKENWVTEMLGKHYAECAKTIHRHQITGDLLDSFLSLSVEERYALLSEWDHSIIHVWALRFVIEHCLLHGCVPIPNESDRGKLERLPGGDKLCQHGFLFALSQFSKADEITAAKALEQIDLGRGINTASEVLCLLRILQQYIIRRE